MTLATLDELLGPVPPEHEYLERFGYREDVVGGRRRYVGRNEVGRAVIGPVRHARGLMNLARRKKSKPVVLPKQERSMKIVIDQAAIERVGREANRALSQVSENLKTVDFSKLAAHLPPAPAPQKEGKLRRFGNWCKEKFYDDEWQRASRNTAGNVLLWSFTALAVLTFVKGAWWVLGL